MQIHGEPRYGCLIFLLTYEYPCTLANFSATVRLKICLLLSSAVYLGRGLKGCFNYTGKFSFLKRYKCLTLLASVSVREI